jgi:hypothetical protein
MTISADQDGDLTVFQLYPTVNSHIPAKLDAIIRRNLHATDVDPVVHIPIGIASHNMEPTSSYDDIYDALFVSDKLTKLPQLEILCI